MKGIVRRWEVLLALASVLVIAGFLAWNAAAGESGTAVVSVDGREACVVDLGAAPDQTISLRGGWGVPVELEIKDHRIRYVNVTCPDHLCEKTGFVHKPGQTAVCMPNRVVVAVA